MRRPTTVMNTFAAINLTLMLLVVFQVKHYVADFPLQRGYMLQKTATGWSFIIPLAVHCGVHAALTLAIVLCVEPSLWWLAVFDFITHFVMDRVKAAPKYLGRFNDVAKPSFWNCFGIDQMVHHLAGYYIIWMLVTAQI